jgi:hypothetical protein
MRVLAGWPLVAAALWAGGAAGGTLSVESADGTLVVSVPVADGATWCLRWKHSVTGGPVADSFVNDGGQMVLARSYLHDYAAGLGEVAGRGEAHAAEGGGYWIDGIDEPVAGNALPLRVGRRSVDHRITLAGQTFDLSDRAAGQRVILRLAP